MIPTVASRHPLWEDRTENRSGRSVLDRGFALDHGKEALATTVLEAKPDVVLKMPSDSPWPFVLTVVMSVFFTALLLQAWWIGGISVAGLLLVRRRLALAAARTGADRRSRAMSEATLQRRRCRRAVPVTKPAAGSA